MSSLHAVYFNAKSRCVNPECRDYHRYGGRGITVCDEWLQSSKHFYRWARENGYERGKWLDRIDNNRGYSPDNCRFVTAKESARNRRSNVWVKAWGEQKLFSDWLVDPRCVVNKNQLRKRLRAGWESEKAISLRRPTGRPRRENK